jgi:hypothetical protein
MGSKLRRGIVVIMVLASTVFAQEFSGKCGTGRYIPGFFPSVDHEEMISTTRPVLQSSEVSLSGHFRIHFDTVGLHAPIARDAAGNILPNATYRTFVDTLKYILDSVWIAQVETFGFAPPVSDNGRGGGNEYDVYIVDLGGGWFGETVPEYDFPVSSGKQNQQYTSFIRVDNDFGFGYRTKGIDALKVTCAHEFQHALQVSNTGLWMNDFYFYEICAEAFEPVVFPDVKDYLNDVRTYFNSIESIPLFTAAYPGYERAIFGYFLMLRHGTQSMADLWNEIRLLRPIPALKKLFGTRQTSLELEYAEFSEWIYFTNTRADSLKYFPDARTFPPLKFYSTVVTTPAVQTVPGTAKSFSTHFIKAYHGSDSTHVILAAANENDLLTGSDRGYSYELRHSLNQFTGSSEIKTNLFAEFSATPASERQFWNYKIQTSSGPYMITSAECFPNPFNPRKSPLFITVDLTFGTDAHIYVYSTSMDLVYSGAVRTNTYSGKRFATWDGFDARGIMAASGIYFYFITDQIRTIRGKFAVVR